MRLLKRALIGAGVLLIIALGLARFGPGIAYELRGGRPNTVDAATFNVGYTTMDFSYTLPDGSAKPLTIAIWYPTAAPMAMYDYQRAVEPGGKVARDAAVYVGLKSPYPLIVFSHGYLGCATIYSFLLQQLAADGYVVAAPDHADATVCSIHGGPGPADYDHPEQRPLDIRATITEMLQQNADRTSRFYQMIDPMEVGVGGHSAGGLTAMGVSGVDSSQRDPRVKAAMMLAETTGDFTCRDYSQMRLPVMFELGERDPDDERHVPRSFPYACADPPKFLIVVKRANHLAFDDTDCIDSPSIDDCVRTRPHVAVEDKFATAFYDYALRHDEQALKTLTTPDPRLTDLEYELH